MPRIRAFNPKQRRRGNRCTVTKTDSVTPVTSVTNKPHEKSTPSSASRRKLVFHSDDNELPHVHKTYGENNVIINMNILCNFLLQNVRCKYCNNDECVELSEDSERRKGCATKLVLKCMKCHTIVTCMSSERTSKYFNVNVRLAYAMRCIGKGQKAARTFCALMDLPPPAAKFERYNEVIYSSINNVAETSMVRAAQESIEENEGNDIAAAFDGSWQKRGHTSLNGVVTATSVDTGKVLDVEVITKFCHGCVKAENTHNCVKNYEGSSGGMEVKGVLNIFMRSVSSRGVRYAQYLGDGDSKGFMAVQKQKPYGEELTVNKLECVGHVQKRLGTRLRKLRQQLSGKKLSDGKCIKGRGRLSDGEIDKLQNYYGMAIRKNKDVKVMKQAVWASYFHKMSTDANHVHNLCPKGLDSWCGYQRQIAGGDEYKHKHSLPMAIMDVIKPVYRDLSDEKLLKKCVHGGTQNPNESFNCCIWERLPKTIFVGANTLKIGVLDAVICFNDGVQSRKLVLQKIGIEPGINTCKALKLIDEERIWKAEKAMQQIHKVARVQERNKKRKRNDVHQENDENYGAGEF